MAENKLIKKYEGFSPDVYRDVGQLPTVGYGANLNSPEVPQMFQEMGLDPETVNKEGLSQDQAEELLQRQQDEKKQWFENIRKKDFAEANLKPYQESALLSTAFNSPTSIDAKMRHNLDLNNHQEVAKQLLLESNPNEIPGIAKRRLGEFQEYSGPDYESNIHTITPEQKLEIRSLINSIKNPNEREKVISDFPFIKDIIPYSPRYLKIRNKFNK